MTGAPSSMSALGPSPAGSPAPRSGPTLFSGAHCGSCRAREGCTASETVEACGDPAEYASPVHPLTTPFAESQSGSWPVFEAFGALPQLGDVLLVADRVRVPLILGVRLASSLASLSRSWSRMPLQPETGVAVLLGADSGIDRAWRELGRLGAALAADGFSAVIAPAYSTWGSDSPYASRISMLQSAHAAAVLARHLPTIPGLAWRYHADLRQWTEWIQVHQIGAVALDCADANSDAEWDRAVGGIRVLASSLRERHAVLPRLIVNGPSTLASIADIAQAWRGPLTIASQQPWQLGVHGKVLNADLSVEVAARWERPEDLVRENGERFSAAVNLWLGQSGRIRRRFG
jgi:hypothetical protein